MTYFTLYLLTSVGKVAALLQAGGSLFFFMTVLGMGVMIFWVIMLLVDTDLTIEEIKVRVGAILYKPLRFAMIAGVLSYSIGTLLPTERDLAIIIGGGATYEALNSDRGKEIGGKAVDLLLKKINAALEEPATDNESTKFIGEVL